MKSKVQISSRSSKPLFPIGSMIYVIDFSWIHTPEDNDTDKYEHIKFGKTPVKVLSEPYIDSIIWNNEELFREFIDVEFEGKAYSVINCNMLCGSLTEYESQIKILDSYDNYADMCMEHTYWPENED